MLSQNEHLGCAENQALANHWCSVEQVLLHALVKYTIQLALQSTFSYTRYKRVVWTLDKKSLVDCLCQQLICNAKASLYSLRRWLPCLAFIASMLRLLGLVTVYCDWVVWQVRSATSITTWQHVDLPMLFRRLGHMPSAYCRDFI